MSSDYQTIWKEFDELLAPILKETDTDSSCVEIGENVSPIPELKIIFDGFGYNEESGEDDDENEMSYALFIHRDAKNEDFIFPDHELTPLGILHRPNEERCFSLWYHAIEDLWETTSCPADEDNSDLTENEVMEILEILNRRYY